MMRAMRIGDFEIRKEGSDTCSVIQYKGDDEDVIIPPLIGKYRPVSIASSFLRRGNRVRSISIPASVESIDDSFFPVLEKLCAVSVGKGSRSFCSVDGVLYDASLYSLLLYPAGKDTKDFIAPSRLGRVASNAFSAGVQMETFSYPQRLEEFPVLPSQCPHLRSFIPQSGSAEDGPLIHGKTLLFYPPASTAQTFSIPEGVEAIAPIPSEAFFPPALRRLFVPASLKSGLEKAVSSVQSIEVDSMSSCYRSLDGVLFSRKRALLAYPGGRKDSIYLTPDGTDRIGEGAFRFSGPKILVIGDGVTAIGAGAFEGSPIEVMIIPPSVTEISVHALYGAKRLKEIHVRKASIAEMFLRGEGRDDLIRTAPSFF